MGYPKTWGPKENIKWQRELPGDGNSSPIVCGGRVFVTTASDKGQERTLLCFDRKDGKELWSKTVQVDEVEKTHQTNPYSGSTPACDGERVVVWHGSPGVFCYSMDGELQWKKELGKVVHIWGYGSSPILYKDKVILNYGPGKNSFMVALDKKTGDILWKQEEDGETKARGNRMAGSWSTPVIVDVKGQPQLVCSMPTRVVAYDPDNGKILWSVGGLPSQRGNLVYTSLIISNDIGVAMGGYKGPAIAFKLGGEGDVTETNRIWRVEAGQPQRIGTGVIIGNEIYMANAGPGTIQCIDLKTGKDRWQERVQGNHWGSMVLAEGRLYVTNQRGTTYVIQPDPESFNLIADNELKEPSNATPAFSDGEIFIRTRKALYCIAKE